MRSSRPFNHFTPEPSSMSIAQDLITKAERRQIRFGIVGLGYVGLPLAVELAQAGYRVLGFDVNPDVVAGLNAGRSHVKDVTDARLQSAVRPVQRHNGPGPAVGAGCDFDLCADSALEVQGSRRQLHRRRHGMR